jgi:eukaryotic-like serine/threonine-protein kinase
MVENTAYPKAGDILVEKYRVDRMLGEGGMGAVARATQLIMQMPVALKFMSPVFLNVDGAVERFIKEGQAAGRIRSEHVVQIFDVDLLESGAPYIAMECLDGVDLQAIIEQGGPLPVARAVHFVVQILRGLQSAHAVGIVHRDMKPSNCFVINRDGEVDFVKLLDFGISKVSQPGGVNLTATNSALGTPLYMAPEQASSPRDVDLRSDIYSVGVIAYELLTSVTPFTSESGELTEILFKLFTADVPPIRSRREDLPEALASVIHKALSRNPAERFVNAAEFAEALRPFASQGTCAYIDKMQTFVPPKLETAGPSDAPAAMLRKIEARKSAQPAATARQQAAVAATQPVQTPDLKGATKMIPASVAPQALPAAPPKRNGVLIGIAVAGGIIVLGAALKIATQKPTTTIVPEPPSAAVVPVVPAAALTLATTAPAVSLGVEAPRLDSDRKPVRLPALVPSTSTSGRLPDKTNLH